ncbi:hypothetical protein ACEQPO_21395 [Bacillus sp. SL00103]
MVTKLMTKAIFVSNCRRMVVTGHAHMTCHHCNEEGRHYRGDWLKAATRLVT